MLQVEGNRVVGVQTRDDDVQRADEFVVAVGPRMMPFMKATTGVRVPVYPITGYSLTAAVTDAPTSCAWRLWRLPCVACPVTFAVGGGVMGCEQRAFRSMPCRQTCASATTPSFT